MKTKFVKSPLVTVRSSLAAVILPMPVSVIYNPFNLFQKTLTAPRIGCANFLQQQQGRCAMRTKEQTLGLLTARQHQSRAHRNSKFTKGQDDSIYSASITMTIKVASLSFNGKWTWPGTFENRFA
tara:strand:+ start:1373 stop:1747 length:375 start_codon:yes stop_codon:yes gene_type:complete